MLECLRVVGRGALATAMPRFPFEGNLCTKLLLAPSESVEPYAAQNAVPSSKTHLQAVRDGARVLIRVPVHVALLGSQV